MSTVRRTDAIFWITLAGSAVAAGAVQISRTPDLPDAVVNDSYFSADSGEIRLLGVCDALSPDVPCWSSDGKPNADLSKQVAETLAKRGNGAQGETTFRFRMKNRLAIFQTPSIEETGKLSARLIGFWHANGHYIQGFFSGPPPLKGPNYSYVTLIEDRKAQSTNLLAHFDCSLGKQIVMACAEGSTGTSGSQTATIGTITRAPESATYGYGGFPMGRPSNSRAWQVVLKLKGDGPGSKLRINIEPLDDKLQLVGETDRFGRPLPPKKPSKNGHGRDIQDWSGGGMNRAIFNVGSAGPYQPEIHGRIWTTYVDPKYIANVRLTLSMPREVQFTDIPLDPRK